MAVTWTYNVPEDGETTVEVTFTSDDPALTHTRAVNAVFEGDVYSAPLTEERVAEVAAGVENKIRVGAISIPEANSEEGE